MASASVLSNWNGRDQGQLPKSSYFDACAAEFLLNFVCAFLCFTLALLRFRFNTDRCKFLVCFPLGKPLRYSFRNPETVKVRAFLTGSSCLGRACSICCFSDPVFGFHLCKRQSVAIPWQDASARWNRVLLRKGLFLVFGFVSCPDSRRGFQVGWGLFRNRLPLPVLRQSPVLHVSSHKDCAVPRQCGLASG